LTAANERSDRGATACPIFYTPHDLKFFLIAHSHRKRAMRVFVSSEKFRVNAAATPETLEYFQIKAILKCRLKAF
jgi:hypothetical protein